MRTEVRVSFGGEDLPGGPEKLLLAAGCGPDVATISAGWEAGTLEVEVVLPAGDERLPLLRALVQQNGQETYETIQDIYTDQELDSARLLLVYTRSAVNIFGGPQLGTTYDMTNACPSCGAGAKQTSAMMIDKGEVKNLKKLRATATYYEDMIVDDGLATQLASLGLTGLSFGDVYAIAKKDESKKAGTKKVAKTKLPWKQVIAAHTMPPMSPRTTGLARDPDCPTCTRNREITASGHSIRVVYRAQDLVGAQDFNLTWEWFGQLRITKDINKTLLPYPMLLVTPKVMRVLRDAGVESFRWTPIRVIDE